MNGPKCCFDVRHFQGKINSDMNIAQAQAVAALILSQPNTTVEKPVWAFAEQLKSAARKAKEFKANAPKPRSDQFIHDSEDGVVFGEDGAEYEGRVD